MRNLFFLFPFIFYSLPSNSQFGFGYNIGYNFGNHSSYNSSYSGFDNCISLFFKHKLLGSKFNCGFQEHGVFGKKYKISLSLGINNLFNNKIMMENYIGVRYLNIENLEKDLVFNNLNNSSFFLLYEFSLLFQLKPKHNALLIGPVFHVMPFEAYTDRASSHARSFNNANFSLLFSACYLFLKNK